MGDHGPHGSTGHGYSCAAGLGIACPAGDWGARASRIATTGLVEEELEDVNMGRVLQ